MSTFAINPGFTRSRVRPAAVRPARCAVAPAAARGVSSVRLTRRGQAVVVLLMLGLLLTVFTVFGPHSAATGEAGTPVSTRTVQVGQGDTLWNIAADVAKPGQTRDMVHQIEELNALTGPGLTVGQRIAVPVS